MEAERALWKFVKEQKPGFVVNAVLPNANFGKILVKGQPASTGDWVTTLFNGNTDALKNSAPREQRRKMQVEELLTVLRMVCGCPG